MRILTFIAVFAFANITLRGQTFTSTSIDKSYQLNDFLTYQIDTTGQELSEILKKPFSSLPQRELYYRPNINFWTKLTIKNSSSANQFVITIDQWNEAELFFFKGWHLATYYFRYQSFYF